MNKVILMGNLTRDPEIRYTQSENSMAIARFSLAVNRRFARQGDTDVDFFNCTAFGRQAEFVEKYFKQGSRIP
ncbi:MAG: single-stranded DNA-binding protein [Eubacterium sp.]